MIGEATFCQKNAGEGQQCTRIVWGGGVKNVGVGKGAQEMWVREDVREYTRGMAQIGEYARGCARGIGWGGCIRSIDLGRVHRDIQVASVIQVQKGCGKMHGWGRLTPVSCYFPCQLPNRISGEAGTKSCKWWSHDHSVSQPVKSVNWLWFYGCRFLGWPELWRRIITGIHSAPLYLWMVVGWGLPIIIHMENIYILDQSTVLLNLNKVFMMKTNQQMDFKEGNVAASLSTSFATLDW